MTTLSAMSKKNTIIAIVIINALAIAGIFMKSVILMRRGR